MAADLHLEAHDAYDLYQLTGVAIPLDARGMRPAWIGDVVAEQHQSDVQGNDGQRQPRRSGFRSAHAYLAAPYAGGNTSGGNRIVNGAMAIIAAVDDAATHGGDWQSSAATNALRTIADLDAWSTERIAYALGVMRGLELRVSEWDALMISSNAFYAGALPDTITIYRDALLDICHDEPEVVSEVAITVIHEIAHHFGIEDDRLHELGWG